MEQDVINLKNHTTQYKVLKDEEIKQKALKTYMDSDEYKKEVEANVKAEKLLQLQNQTVQYENLAQESKNNDAAMQKVMKSAEYIKANNDWLDAQANAKAAQLIGSIRTKIQADEDSSNEALMNADFKNAFEALHSKVKLVNDFSSGKKLKSEGFDNELREVAQNMTKITDAATRQAVQSAYDAVRATVVESQEKELQQTKTDLVNAFLRTKSQVGHYAADGTYVPAGGTYIPPNPPREAPAPGLPKTFTSSHGHRHRHAPKPTQQPTQQPTVQNTAPQPTVQNTAPQPTVKVNVSPELTRSATQPNLLTRDLPKNEENEENHENGDPIILSEPGKEPVEIPTYPTYPPPLSSNIENPYKIDINSELMKIYRDIIINNYDSIINLIDQSGLIILPYESLIHIIAILCDVQDSDVKIQFFIDD
ncbi:kinase-related family, partial [Trichomonas vaginalis G3]|uniref:kinase-related family n=1 Tax=Trichomonas vaginalis (strain ATCC PRA-98 / G3) TaxID=412133 RepID=UPI0021E58A4E